MKPKNSAIKNGGKITWSTAERIIKNGEGNANSKN